MMKPSEQQLELAISELLRAAKLCVSSGNPAVRAVGIIHGLRAAKLSAGEIEPKLLTERQAARIIALIPRTLEANRALGDRRLR